MGKAFFLFQILLLLGLVIVGSLGIVDGSSSIQLVASDYRSGDVLVSDFLALETQYPEYVSHEIFGTTVGGASMYLFKIGKQDSGSMVMFDGACHGNEIVGSEVLYYYAVWLLQEVEQMSTEILHRKLTLIVPIVNMDGYPNVRKNAHGVDLNRNFSWNWNGTASTGGGVSDDPNSGNYRGPSPSSEPETKAYEQFWSKYKPQQYLNLHTFDSPQIWFTRGATGRFKTYLLDILASYSSLATDRTQPTYANSEDGGTGNYPCTAYYDYGIQGWSCEVVLSNPAYSEVLSVLDKWLPFFITLSLNSVSAAERVDVNGDGLVDMKDATVSAGAYGTRAGDALWNPHFDITGPEPFVPDGKVDMRDVSLVAKHVGEHYS